MFNPKQFVISKKAKWDNLNEEQKDAVKKASKTLAIGGTVLVGIYALQYVMRKEQEEESPDEEIVEEEYQVQEEN